MIAQRSGEGRGAGAGAGAATRAVGAGLRAAAYVALSAVLLAAGCDRGEPQSAPASAPAADAAQGAATPIAPTAPPADAPMPIPQAIASVESDPLAAMRHVAGVDCKRSDAGIYACTAPGYDIAGADRACAENDSGFGAVLADDGATLYDRFPAEGGSVVAHLPKGQFVCVQFVADATDGGEGWAYVAAIPPALVKACAGKARCGDGAFRPEWAGTPPPGECAVAPEGRYTTACAAGWAKRAAIDEYSMGL